MTTERDGYIFLLVTWSNLRDDNAALFKLLRLTTRRP